MIEGQKTIIRCPNRDYTLIGFEIDPVGEGVESLTKHLQKHASKALIPATRLDRYEVQRYS